MVFHTKIPYAELIMIFLILVDFAPSLFLAVLGVYKVSPVRMMRKLSGQALFLETTPSQAPVDSIKKSVFESVKEVVMQRLQYISLPVLAMKKYWAGWFFVQVTIFNMILAPIAGLQLFDLVRPCLVSVLSFLLPMGEAYYGFRFSTFLSNVHTPLGFLLIVLVFTGIILIMPPRALAFLRPSRPKNKAGAWIQVSLCVRTLLWMFFQIFCVILVPYAHLESYAAGLRCFTIVPFTFDHRLCKDILVQSMESVDDRPPLVIYFQKEEVQTIPTPSDGKMKVDSKVVDSWLMHTRFMIFGFYDNECVVELVRSVSDHTPELQGWSSNRLLIGRFRLLSDEVQRAEDKAFIDQRMSPDMRAEELASRLGKIYS